MLSFKIENEAYNVDFAIPKVKGYLEGYEESSDRPGPRPRDPVETPKDNPTNPPSSDVIEEIDENDVPLGVLPQTGGYGRTIFFGFGLMLIFAVISNLLMRRKGH